MRNFDQNENYDHMSQLFIEECESVIDPELDGTRIPHAERWRYFVEIPVTVPLRTRDAGASRITVLGRLGSDTLRIYV